MTTTEASDILKAVSSIYEVMTAMEVDYPEGLPVEHSETIRVGCVSILAGLSYFTSVADQMWFSADEQRTLEVAHEYALWRLETISNDVQ